MYDVRTGNKSVATTPNLEHAMMLIKLHGKIADTQVYDYRTNKLLYEWSCIGGLREFLME
jgi:hypothetical protein